MKGLVLEAGGYLTLRIAKYKVPKRFVFLETLPQTPYGKVEKAKVSVMLSEAKHPRQEEGDPSLRSG